jgi:oligogalacturonide transporter
VKPNAEKLSTVTKIGFGLGDLYGGGSMMIIGFFYLYFLTDVVRISPSLAGTVFLVSKIWDAVSDPLMGTISDRTRTRFGRRRPYFLAGVALIFLSFFLLWYPVDFDLEMHRFIFVLGAYLFFSTVLTMVMIPYNALASELTLDYNERTALSTIRIFFSSLSSLLCAVIPMEIVKILPDVRQGYITMGVSFGLFFALPFIIVFLTTFERPQFQEHTARFSLRRMFLEPFKTRSFIHILFMYLFAFVAVDAVMSVIIYFMTYYLHRGAETNYVLGVLLVVQIIALPFFAWLSGRAGKRHAFTVAIGLWILFMLFSFLVRPGSPPPLIYVFAGCIGFATGGVVVMIYAIFPDMPDIDELYSGERREGIYSGLFTFMRKLSSAVGIFLISNAIQLAGYRPPEEETVDGAVQMVEQVQTPQFIMILRIVFAVLPVVLLAFGLYGAWRYGLTPRLHDKLKEFLQRRRNGELEETEAERQAEYFKARLERSLSAQLRETFRRDGGDRGNGTA